MGKDMTVIVLAGTKWQIPLISRLKEKGFKVVVFNLFTDSPGFVYADEYCVVDILDCEKCLQYAQKFHPAAIMSEECDIAVPSVAWLSTKLNLNSIGIDMAQLYTNKYEMRKFGRKNGFATPQFFKCKTKDEAVNVLQSYGGKMIMKPLNGNSSRGVYTVNSVKDVCRYFPESINFSRGENCILLEEYIEGTEFTVDGIKTEKGHVSLAISEKEHFGFNENIANSLFFSYDSTRFDYDALRKINDDFVNMSGLRFGLTHAEYKYQDGKFYLMEIGARGGGNLISAVIVPLLSGVDNYEYLINKTLGVPCDETLECDAKLKERCAVLKFFDIRGQEGIVQELRGEDFLQECERVVDYSISCKVGEKVMNASDDSKRIGYYIAYGESREELEQLIQTIDLTFEIVLEDTE